MNNTLILKNKQYAVVSKKKLRAMQQRIEDLEDALAMLEYYKSKEKEHVSFEDVKKRMEADRGYTIQL